jgi:hypothetical protein
MLDTKTEGGGNKKLTAREVEGSGLHSSDTSIKSSIASVNSVEDAVLEATWVLEIEVQLAVLAALRDGNSWTDGCNILIKDQCEANDLLACGCNYFVE